MAALTQRARLLQEENDELYELLKHGEIGLMKEEVHGLRRAVLRLESALRGKSFSFSPGYNLNDLYRISPSYSLVIVRYSLPEGHLGVELDIGPNWRVLANLYYLYSKTIGRKHTFTILATRTTRARCQRVHRWGETGRELLQQDQERRKSRDFLNRLLLLKQQRLQAILAGIRRR
jgi:hypothetical protein